MTRLGISVEGATEREFVSRVLAPHLAGFGVAATAVDMRGNVSLDRVCGVLPGLLGDFERVSTMYDFYRFKRRDALDVTALEAAIGELVAGERRARLIPYVQQYEFEALLFAVPEQAVAWLGGGDEQLTEMRRAVQRCGSPERVNDSPQTSPSHRMLALFGQPYDKKLHGPEIIEQAGLAAIRAECPRFNDWIGRLEALGQ